MLCHICKIGHKHTGRSRNKLQLLITRCFAKMRFFVANLFSKFRFKEPSKHFASLFKKVVCTMSVIWVSQNNAIYCHIGKSFRSLYFWSFWQRREVTGFRDSLVVILFERARIWLSWMIVISWVHFLLHSMFRSTGNASI